MKHGLFAYFARLLALLLLLSLLILFSDVSAAGTRIDMESITADISIVSAEEIRTRLTFKINADGRTIKDFKLSGEASFYKWSRDSMHCLTETGKKVGLTRMPRADGLTAMKISPKRRIKAKTLTCIMEGNIDEQYVEHILSSMASGHYHFALALPALTKRTGTLNVTIHFPDMITEDDVSLDDMTAEEFSSTFFASAVTLTASSVPAYQTKTVELYLGKKALGSASDFYGSLQPPDRDIIRFVGMKTREGIDLRFTVVIFLVSVFLFILLLVRSAFRRNRGSPVQGPPYLVFAGISGLTRAVFTLCLIMLFAVFTLSESPAEAMLFFTCCVIMHLRLNAARPAPAQKERDNPVQEAGELKPKKPLFSYKSAGGLTLLALLLCAAVPTVLHVSSVSMESAVCLAFAFVLSIVYLFFSPQADLRPAAVSRQPSAAGSPPPPEDEREAVEEASGF